MHELYNFFNNFMDVDFFKINPGGLTNTQLSEVKDVIYNI